MIRLSKVNHHFKIGKKGNETIVPVLHDIDLHIAKGEIVSVIGRSGSGKSTLLNLISGYIHPVSGTIEVDDVNVTTLDEGKWSDFRLQHFGFIFQSFQLIPSMTAWQNVEFPLILKGVPEKHRINMTAEMLRKVDLEAYCHHYPSELSGGQQQRVSVARALILKPPIILADEPTGSLDSENESALLDMIQELNRDLGITFLIITHDDHVAAIANRIIKLQDGRIVQEAQAHAFQR